MKSFDTIKSAAKREAAKAESELKEVRKLGEKIDSILSDYTAEVRGAKTRLEAAKKELAYFYALRLLEGLKNQESTESKISSLEHEIVGLEIKIQYGPDIIKNIEKINARNKDASRRAQSAIDRKKALERYEQLKEELRKLYTEAKLKDLRKASCIVGEHGIVRRDYEEFVAELKNIHPKVSRYIRL